MKEDYEHLIKVKFSRCAIRDGAPSKVGQSNLEDSVILWIQTEEILGSKEGVHTVKTNLESFLNLKKELHFTDYNK